METHQDGGSGTRKREGPNIQGMPACFQSSFIYFTDSMTTPHPPNNENMSCSLLDGCWTSNRSKRGSKLGPASIPTYDAFFFHLFIYFTNTTNIPHLPNIRVSPVFCLCQVPSPKSGDISQPRHLGNPRSLPRHTIHLLPLCHRSAIAAPSPTHLVTQQCLRPDPTFPPPAVAFNEVIRPLPSARGRMRMNRLANDPRARRTTTRKSRRGREAGMGKRRRRTRGEGKVPGTYQLLPLPTPLIHPLTRKTSADKAKEEAAAKAAAKRLK